ncbi:MAG TPA: hypothetical protein VEY05_17990 [Beijerinckiaceae bacterium]|nr:hypothetical protein [Beijerinckiaceae bacterium]
MAGIALLPAFALRALRLRPRAIAASTVALLLALLASPIAAIHDTLFLLPLW